MNANTITKLISPGSNIYKTITANNKEGKLIIISAKRIIIFPPLPPKNPDIRPKTPPIVIDNITALPAINIVFCVPTISLAIMLLPRASAPKKYIKL